MRHKNYKLSKLYDADGDVSKRWYIYYYLLNPATNRLERFRHFISNHIKTASERYEVAAEMQRITDDLLKSGQLKISFKEHEPTPAIYEGVRFAILSMQNRDLEKSTIKHYRSAANEFIKFLEIKR